MLAVVAAIAAPRVMELTNKEEAAEEVHVVTVGGQAVQQGKLTTEVELIGSTTAQESVSVIPPMVAKVKEVPVVVGSYVAAGDVLFTLDPENLENQLTQAENGVAMAELGLRTASAGLTNANLALEMAKANYDMQLANYEFGKANLAKYEEMYAAGLVTETELEQMRLQASEEQVLLMEKQLEQASGGVGQAKIGYENASLSLEQARDGLKTTLDLFDDMKVTAPISGYITALNVSEDNFASNAQPAVVIQNYDTIVVHVNVTQALINKLAIGNQVGVKIEAVSEEALEGTIKSMATAADARSLLYPVAVEVPNQDQAIKPGMFATVNLVTGISENALYVPSEAVLLRDGTYSLYVQKGDNQVEKRQVEIGLDTGYYTEILNGVRDTDVVITKGIGLIDEVSLIKVIRSDQ